MQPAGVHAVNDVTHALKHPSHFERCTDVDPTGVHHHAQRGCTTQLGYELAHTVLHLQGMPASQHQTLTHLLQDAVLSWARTE
jgi:hypothetical protein